MHAALTLEDLLRWLTTRRPTIVICPLPCFWCNALTRGERVLVNHPLLSCRPWGCEEEDEEEEERRDLPVNFSPFVGTHHCPLTSLFLEILVQDPGAASNERREQNDRFASRQT